MVSSFGKTFSIDSNCKYVLVKDSFDDLLMADLNLVRFVKRKWFEFVKYDVTNFFSEQMVFETHRLIYEKSNSFNPFMTEAVII